MGRARKMNPTEPASEHDKCNAGRGYLESHVTYGSGRHHYQGWRGTQSYSNSKVVTTITLDGNYIKSLVVCSTATTIMCRTLLNALSHFSCHPSNTHC